MKVRTKQLVGMAETKYKIQLRMYNLVAFVICVFLADKGLMQCLWSSARFSLNYAFPTIQESQYLIEARESHWSLIKCGLDIGLLIN